MAKKQKRFPGEKDKNVFARVASKAVRKAREDNRGELDQPVTLDAKDAQLISDALQILNPDSRTTTKRARELENIFWNLRAAKPVNLVASSRILITVSGGIADYVPETVPAGITVEIIDFDNLKDDLTFTLAQLSPAARRYAKANR